jgi:O-antigen/teichoic acid export membrane protein
MSSLRAAAESGLAWTALSRWGARLSGLAALLVVARYINPAQFGLAALTTSILVLVQVLAEAGLATYLVGTRRDDQRTLSTAFWVNLLLAALLGGLLVLGAPTLERASGVAGLAQTLRWVPLALVALGVSAVPEALLQQRLQFGSLAVRELIGVLAGAVVAVVLAVSGAGVWALVAQSIVQQIAGAIVLLCTVRWRPSFVLDLGALVPMASFGSKSAVTSLLAQVRDRVEDFVLGSTAGASAVGNWAVASRGTRLIADLTNSIVQTVSLSLLARLNHDREQMNAAYSRMLSLSMVALVPALTLTAMTVPDLLPMLVGDQWTAAVVPGQLIALTAVVAGVSTYDRSYYLAVGRPGIELTLTVTLLAPTVLSIAVGARYGLVVLATVSLVRAAVIGAIRVTVLVRTCGVPVRLFRQPLLIVALTLAWGAVVHLAVGAAAIRQHGLDALVQAAVFAALYPPLIRVIARDTYDDLRSTLRRVLDRAIRVVKQLGMRAVR